MKNLILLTAVLSSSAFAEGYYYPVPANPPAYIYALPPAYIVPPEQGVIPPPVYIPPVQRGYHPPPPDGWGNSKLSPLPKRNNLNNEED